jgi:putative peptidoglycan lipid II flippase
MVKSIVKKGISALISSQTNIFSAAFFIIVTTVFSQVLGFVKYRLLVSIFGASHELGVFLASFRIPDFLFQILIAGALSSAFIPIFSEFVSEEKKKEAYLFASSIVNLGLIVFSVLSIFVIIFAYPLCALVAPGFSPSEIELMANLTRIILLSQLFFTVGLIVTSILQSFHHFLIPGIASSFYNIGIIIALIFLAPVLSVYGAALGVLLGSFLFLLVQLPLLRKVGYVYTVRFVYDESVKKLVHLMIPRSFMLMIAQIAITANVFFASLISARSLVIFDLAQSLMMAPVILFGQSIAQASFPLLSIKKNNTVEFLSIFLTSFYQILYLTLPISMILIVLRIPVVRLFYGASRFDWQATVDTGRTLAYFALSISAQALIFLLSRAFYAHKDTKTPLFITIVSVCVTIGLSYFFITWKELPIYYLAFAFSLGNILSVFLLLFFINKKVLLPKFEILVTVTKILLATVVMGISLYIPIKLLDQLVFDTTRTINLLLLTGIASILGFSSYIFFTWLLDIQEAAYIINVVKKVGDWRKILNQVDEPLDGSKLNS